MSTDDETWDWVIPVALLLGTIAFFAVGTVVVAAWAWHSSHVACLRLHEQTHYDTRMAGNMWSGECYLRIDGRWVPEDRYRSVPDGGL
jgi:hypothetical protein